MGYHKIVTLMLQFILCQLHPFILTQLLLLYNRQYNSGFLQKF